MVNLTGSPITVEKHFGKTGLGKIKSPGATTAPKVEHGLDRFVYKILIETRIAVIRSVGEVMHADVPSFSVVGVVAGKEIKRRTDRHVADVARVIGIDFQLGAIGTHPGYSPTVQSHHFSVGALGVFHAKVTHGDVEPTIDAHAAAIGGVIRSPRMAKTESNVFKKDFVFIGHAVSGGVAERAEKWRMNEIQRVADEVPSPRAVNVGHKILKTVRLAVAIGVAAGNNLTHVLLLAERAVVVDRDIHRPISGGGECGRVFNIEGFGPIAEFEFGGQGESRSGEEQEQG